jgi:glyoxylase-like metal-dependent hydrolase (beta-lactamase superfamily II)
MKIHMNTGGIAATNCFLIADEIAKQAVLFDAPDHTTQTLLDEAQRQGWDIIGLWLTHGHFDHIADHAAVNQRFPNAKVLIHRLDEPKLLNPKVQTALFNLPFTIPPRKPDGLLEDAQKLQLGSLEFQVIHTPGHSPGHVVYHCASEQVLVGGDLIICGAVGRTDLPDSRHADQEASLRRVMKLPPTTRLLPGHGKISTLGDELRTNPYVQVGARHASPFAANPKGEACLAPTSPRPSCRRPEEHRPE